MKLYRRVLVDTPNRRVRAAFSVPIGVDAAEVSVRLRQKGVAPHRLTFDSDKGCWIAAVIDEEGARSDQAHRLVEN